MYCNVSIIHLIVHIFRGNLLKALREKYFNDAKKNDHSFKGWKPDEINEVNAITWESVDITCFSAVESDLGDGVQPAKMHTERGDSD